MFKKFIIPIFPLSGVIFFPNTNLPLNIFEIRYLEMVDFALSENKLIGMIQPKNSKDFYNLGCIGKITDFHTTEDGKYIINLRGKNYFKLLKEVYLNKKFRTFEVNLIDNENKKQALNKSIFDKFSLIKKFKLFFKKNNYEIDFDVINKIESKELIKLIAMSCSFSANEKQMLLETENLNELSDNIIALFEFYKNENNHEKSIN